MVNSFTNHCPSFSLYFDDLSTNLKLKFTILAMKAIKLMKAKNQRSVGKYYCSIYETFFSSTAARQLINFQMESVNLMKENPE